MALVVGDFGYLSDGLRSGAALSLSTGDTAAELVAQLRVAECRADAIGAVRGAAELAAAMVRSRDAHVAIGEQVSSMHVDLGGRSAAAAVSGDALTESSSAAAASVTG